MNTVARVLDASDPRVASKPRGGKPVTPKQIAKISELMDEKIIDDFNAAEIAGELRAMQYTRDASAIITRLVRLPNKDPQKGTTPAKFAPEAGLYRAGDDVVEVVISKAGQWYARVVRPTGRPEYIGKRINMTNAERITDDQAKELLAV